LEVLQQIRKTKNILELPVILISALSEQATVTHGIRLGANDYISKPMNLNVVRARVNIQIMVKQIMDERRRINAYLTQTNEMKARMIQVASHDLKNPLNNLKMLTTIMRKQVNHPDKMQKLIDMMEGSLSSMLGVIKDFLDNSYAREKTLTVSLQPCDSSVLVRQVLEQYAVAARSKDISFRVANINGVVIADDSRLLQALDNLVASAIKYTQSGSTITVKSHTSNGKWRLLLIDKTHTIAEEEQAYLFQPFSKHHTITQSAGENGNGLGLWIAKQVMELQRGRIGVACPASGGSIFWLELPLVLQPAEV
jgi:signal transduction histidine kinase